MSELTTVDAGARRSTAAAFAAPAIVITTGDGDPLTTLDGDVLVVAGAGFVTGSLTTRSTSTSRGTS